MTTCLLPVLGLLALLAQASSAQDAPVNTADPRDTKDPRNTSDPRGGADPRERTDPRDSATDAGVQPPGPELFEALYAAGQDARLKQAFGENGWNLLQYIQSQCEAWLSLRSRAESPSPQEQEKLTALEEKGRKLARFADEALLDTRFQTYVDAVYHWGAEQRQLYRESQDLYRKGTAIAAAAHEPTETLAALTPLQQALDRARRLGDTRTQSLALVAIGNVQAAVRDEQSARETMREAERVGREVRDLDGVWSALAVLYESAIRTLDWDGAEASLQEQYLIARDVSDEATMQRVLEQLVNLNKYREQNR